MERFLIEVPAPDLWRPGRTPQRERFPAYEETIKATGIDPAKLRPRIADSCGCEWGGHGIYRL